MTEFEQTMTAKIAEWRSAMKSAFGLEIDPANPQAQLTSRGGNLVLMTPSIPDGALFITMIFEPVPDIESRVLKYLLARNLFLSNTSGGWLSFEPQESRICYQYRWDGFMFSSVENIMSILTAFTERADDIGVEIRDFSASNETGSAMPSPTWAGSSDFVVKL